jgi:predicted O-linked N-acetylglucosamine transferase (SPINDLY family)
MGGDQSNRFDASERIAPSSPAGPRSAEQFARAQTLQRQGQVTSARQAYQEILEVEPDHFGALSALGMLAGQSNDLQRAVQYFERAIAVEPRSPGAQCNLGLILKLLGQRQAALECFDRAIALDNRNAVAYHCRAGAYNDLGRTGEALANYDQAVALNTKFVDAYYGRGELLQQSGRLLEAIASYDQASRLKPDHFESHANKALALCALGRPVEALASCDQALALQPNQAQAHVLRGNILKALDRSEAALASYDRALSIDPGNAEAHCNRGAALQRFDRIDEALASVERAIAIKPDYAEAYFHRGYLLRVLNRFDSAAAAYKTVAALAPAFEFLPGNRLETNLQVCDWSEYDPLVREIAAGVETGAHVSHPLIVMAVTESARLQHKVARTWAEFACPANGALGRIASRARPQRLTVGYFSADLHEHPIGRLLADLIEIHDRSRFEVIAFSLGQKTPDEFRQRLARAFDRFVEVRERSDLEVAALARSLNVDIAVDLGGYSSAARPRIFALRAAPVQVSYLGYLGTMGASYIDYIVADRTAVTPASESHFSEKIIYMPDCHQVNDRKRRIADKVFTREELGLPSSGFVFCCLNTSYKIVPATFAGWMRILKAVPESVLLLYASHAATENNLRIHATRHGVDPQRLVFGARLPPAEHLARYRTADLFLDTLPYNAGTTTSDALWAGLPVLTLAGESFAGRIAASLLTALGVPELITSTQQEYEQLAIDLALHPDRLTQIRARVQDQRLTSPLFDTPRFARNLEAAFTAIHARYQAGSAPDHIRL